MRLSEIYRPKNLKKSNGPDSVHLKKPVPVRELASRPSATVQFRKFPAPNLPQPSETPNVSFEPLEHKAPNVYAQLIHLSEDILSGLSATPMKLPDLEALCEGIGSVIESLEQDSSPLLELTERSTPDDHLPGHIANVTILSIALSQEMNWVKDVQRSVGLGAMLHDVGLVFHRTPISDSQALDENQINSLRHLPKDALESLKKFLESLAPASRNVVTNILLQSQKRILRRGTPQPTNLPETPIEAQVVGLCDSYEAISHPRPHRKRKIAHESLRYLIELAGQEFDGILLKKLWSTLTLFPPGSFVQLNTGEIARVVKINKTLPTRPIIKVVATSAKGDRISSDKIIDLAQMPGIAIEKAVDECSLELSDLRLLLELRAQKWWVQ